MNQNVHETVLTFYVSKKRLLEDSKSKKKPAAPDTNLDDFAKLELEFGQIRTEASH